LTFRCRPLTLSASFHIRGRLLNASTQAPSPAACSCAITSPQHTQHARDTTRAIHTMQRAANTTRPKQQRECAATRPALAARAHLPRRRLARVARGTGKRGPDLRQQPHLRALFWKPVWDNCRPASPPAFSSTSRRQIFCNVARACREMQRRRNAERTCRRT